MRTEDSFWPRSSHEYRHYSKPSALQTWRNARKRAVKLSASMKLSFPPFDVMYQNTKKIETSSSDS